MCLQTVHLCACKLYSYDECNPWWLYSDMLCRSLQFAAGLRLFVPFRSGSMRQTCYTFPVRVRQIQQKDLSTVCGSGDPWRDVCHCLFLGVSSSESQCACYLTTEVFHQKINLWGAHQRSSIWRSIAKTGYLSAFEEILFSKQLRYTIPF